MAWADSTFCGHGRTFNQDCDYCEIIGLKESLSWMTRRVKRNESRLVELKAKIKDEKAVIRASKSQQCTKPES